MPTDVSVGLRRTPTIFGGRYRSGIIFARSRTLNPTLRQHTHTVRTTVLPRRAPSFRAVGGRARSCRLQLPLWLTRTPWPRRTVGRVGACLRAWGGLQRRVRVSVRAPGHRGGERLSLLPAGYSTLCGRPDGPASERLGHPGRATLVGLQLRSAGLLRQSVLAIWAAQRSLGSGFGVPRPVCGCAAQLPAARTRKRRCHRATRPYRPGRLDLVLCGMYRLVRSVRRARVLVSVSERCVLVETVLAFVSE